MKAGTVSLACALLLGANIANAAPTVVEAVQYPAWLERGGNSVPLTPGTALQAQDRLRTGANARVQLKMPEGSAVKLGENAQFVIERVEDRGVFRAALSVLAGAFRFTTDAVRKATKRDIEIKVKNATAGIRGTDLWGKSGSDRDIVCLIEGRISVQREAEQPVAMDQALQFYIAPKVQGRADPAQRAQLAAVDQNQLMQWAAETEIAAGQGAARLGGKWKVVAISSPDQAGALAVYDKLRAEGYAAEIRPRGAGDQRAYDVRIGGLPSKAEAESLGARLEAVTGAKARATM